MIKLPCGILVRVDKILCVFKEINPVVKGYHYLLQVEGVKDPFAIGEEDFKVIEEMTDESE